MKSMEEPWSHPKYQRSFLEKSFQMILDHLEDTLKGNNDAAKIRQPSQLRELINFSLSEDPIQEQKLIEQCKKIVDYSVKPYHPHFHNTLFGGFDQFSACGAIITPLVNGNMYTYEMAPAFTLMEKQIYLYFQNKLGWQYGQGLMTAGGSVGNIMAIQIARYHKFPQTKDKGVRQLPPLKILVADNGHYSMKKGAFLCGLGIQSLVTVKSNQLGQMDPSDLDQQIQSEINKGNIPFLVCALLGSTVQGSVDSIQDISKITKKHKIWLHVDACYGGVMFFSKKLRLKLGNCKDIDSIVFDPHKGMLVPLQATIFLCQHLGLMDQCNSVVAQYLFHKQRSYYDNQLDTGNRSLFCGRVIDVLKLWTYFQGNGTKGIEEQINMKYDLAQNITKYMRQNPQNFILYIKETQLFNICFWCLPKGLKPEDRKKMTDEEYFSKLSKVTVQAKKIMVSQGKMLVGYSSIKNSPYFWRIVLANPYNTFQQIITQLKWLSQYCQQAFSDIYNQI